MPFMRGTMPLRRTLFYMRQGKILFRDEVKIFTIAYHRNMPNPAQQGARDFVFWHWSQLVFRNPRVQVLKFDNISVAPFALAFLRDGREVPFDLEWMTNEQIQDVLIRTLCNTQLVRKRDWMERMRYNSPAEFGSSCQRQCICEVQGQHPCTSLIYAPKYLRESWRWAHKTYQKDKPILYPKKEGCEAIERDPPLGKSDDDLTTI